jgi:hypothetical protein
VDSVEQLDGRRRREHAHRCGAAGHRRLDRLLRGQRLPAPGLVFLLIPLAVVVPAFIGERAEEFDNELRYFNWLLLIVLNAALVAPGAWLGRRRA